VHGTDRRLLEDIIAPDKSGCSPDRTGPDSRGRSHADSPDIVLMVENFGKCLKTLDLQDVFSDTGKH